MRNWKFMAVFAALCLLIPAFVGCGDKKDDEPELPDGGDEEQTVDVTRIEGSYSGALNWKVMTSEGILDGKYEISISKSKDASDKVDVVIPECSFTMPGSSRPQTIPSFTVEGADVSESGNVYTVSKDAFAIKVGETTYEGSNLSGKVVGRDVQIVYSMQPGSMPMLINFTFTGTLK